MFVNRFEVTSPKAKDWSVVMQFYEHPYEVESKVIVNDTGRNWSNKLEDAPGLFPAHFVFFLPNSKLANKLSSITAPVKRRAVILLFQNRIKV